MMHSILKDTDDASLKFDNFDNCHKEQQLKKKEIIDLADLEYDWRVGDCDEVIFYVIEGIEEFFAKCNNELHKLRIHNKPLVCIVNRGVDVILWVTLVIVYQDKQLFCYYIDPTGDSIDKGIKQYLDSKQIHCPEINTEETNANTGIFALKSLESIFESKTDRDKITLQLKPSFSSRIGDASMKIKKKDETINKLKSELSKDSRRFKSVNFSNLHQSLDEFHSDLKNDRGCVRTLLISPDLKTNCVCSILTMGFRDKQITASYVATRNSDTSLIQNLLHTKNMKLIFIKEDISGELSILQNAKTITNFYRNHDNVATVEKDLVCVSKSIEVASSRLKARKKIEEKLNGCKLVIEKTKGNKNVLARFNMLILFLETLALEDREISVVLGEEKLKRIRKRMIDDNDFQIIKILRSERFLHRSEENASVIINPSFIKHYVSTKTKNEIYVKMAFYIDQTIMKLNRKAIQTKKIDIQSFLKTKAEIDNIVHPAEDEKTVNSRVCAYFRSFLRKKPETYKSLQQRTFELLVNVIPLLECLGYIYRSKNRNGGTIEVLEFKNIRIKRNEFVHNFHKFPSERARQYELQKFSNLVKLSFFKYVYSQKVKDQLIKNPEKHTIGSELMKDLTKIFSQSGSEQLRADIRNKHGQMFQSMIKNLEPTSSSEFPFRNFIVNYVQIMHLIDNDSMNDERKRKYPEMPLRYDNLSAEKRLYIYQQFTIVKDLYASQNREYKIKRLGLEEEMVKFGISKSVSSSIADIFVEKKKNVYEGNKNVDLFVKKVCEDIRILSIIEHKDIIPISQIIELYAKRKKLNGKDMTIERKFQSIPKGKSLTVNGVRINTDSFVLNILEMFSTISGQGIQIFKSVKNAFDDSDFLSFLCHNKIEFHNDYLGMPCLYPYIVHLLQYDKIELKFIKPSDLHRMIDHFLEENTNESHLKKILELNDDILVKIFNLHDLNASLDSAKTKIYKEFSSRINENNIDNVLPMIKYENHAEGILNVICSHANSNDDKSIKLLKKTLDVLDRACGELWNAREYDKLNNIIHIAAIDLIISDLIEKDSADLSALKIVRRRAAIYNNELFKLHDRASELLVSIKNALGDVSQENISTQSFYFLVCADLAYAKRMKEKYEKAYNELENLYIAIIRASLLHPKIHSYKLVDSTYKEIINSNNYKTILERHPKYLDILKIRGEMAFQLKSHAQSIERESSVEAIKNYEKSLKIYREVMDLKGDLTKGQDLVKNMRSVAYVSRRLADLRLFIHEGKKMRNNDLELTEIVKLYSEAQRIYTKMFEIQRKELWETHPSNIKITEDIFYLGSKIAYCYNRLGYITWKKESEMNKKTNTPLIHLSNALDLYKNIYECRSKYLTVNHKYLLIDKNGLSKTNYNLARYFYNNGNSALAREHNEANVELLKELTKLEFGKSKEHLQRAMQFQSMLS